MYKLLNHIDNPSELRKLSRNELPVLAAEARDFILDIVSVKSGHLGASLGVMELTVALHYYYNTPEDVLIWDVGHQAYGHKLLTGRKQNFETLRQLNGMAGFPVMTESPFDAFGTGHSSTSISAITGMALANRLQNRNKKHIAVIGDASIVSGMAFEGLNHLGATDLDVMIILNDNNIGIDPAVGALQNHFNNIEDQTEADFFEALGFHYHGIVDGHNFDEIFAAFDELEKVKQPKLLHFRTVKGKGYALAEKDQVLWHAPGKFDKKTGEIQRSEAGITYQQVAGNSLEKILYQNPKAVVITPAMPTGSGLVGLMKKFPERVWDVGIAEQHAVTLAAGLAAQGMIPYCVIYSTFLQRAYDQLIHDVALQKLPVVFLIDRAGVVGSDGATHHGYYDISFLNSISEMTVSCPADETELDQLIQMSAESKSPFSIRYPKGEIANSDLFHQPTVFGKAKKIKETEDGQVTVITTGDPAQTVSKAIEGIPVNWFHFPFVKPLDFETLEEIHSEFLHSGKHAKIVTYESGIENGGFGQTIRNFFYDKNGPEVIVKAYPDRFIEHGSVSELNKILKLDEIHIRTELETLLSWY